MSKVVRFTILALLTVSLALMLMPGLSFAALPLLEEPLVLPADLGSGLPGLPELPLGLDGLLNLSPTAPALPGGGATPPAYSGSAEGSAAGVNLPADLGGLSLNSATGAISPQGGLVPDVAGTPQNEALATSAGAVNLASLTSPLAAFGIGSSSSAAPPESGGTDSIFDFALPGLGAVKIGWQKSLSTAAGTDNQISLLIIEIEALDLGMVIPIVQSQASSAEEDGAVTSTGSTDLIASQPGEPLVVGAGMAGGEDVAAVNLLNAGSTSTSDGDTAGSESYWSLLGLSVAGTSLAAVDDQSGLEVVGTTLLPAPAGDNSTFLAVEDPLLGLGGVYIGEKQSAGDGTTSASGAANIIRVGLLGIDELLVLGHAESSAAVAAEDDNDDDDDDSDSNPKPEEKPNPGIGPRPPADSNPNPQPNDSSSTGSGPGSSQDEFSRAGRLPFTGLSLLLIGCWLAALALAVVYFLRLGRRGSAAV